MKTSFFISCTLVLLFFASSCQDPVYTPKPRSYPRVDYPEKTYQLNSSDACQFSFEYPNYCLIQQDKQFFEEAPPSDCWFDVYYFLQFYEYYLS